MNDHVPLIRSFSSGDETYLQRLLSCPYCTGFHTGWITFLLGGGSLVGTEILLFSLASAVFCYFCDSLLDYLDSNSKSDGMGSESVSE